MNAPFNRAHRPPLLQNPPQDDLEALVSLYRQGALVQAHAAAAALRLRYPRGEVLAHISGAISAGLGRLDEAIGLFDAAIALAPDYAEAHNSRANALKALGRTQEALGGYTAAIRHMPAYAQAHLNRGIALRTLGRPEEALACFDRAIALDPQLGQAYESRGNALLDLGRPDDALRDYEAAIPLKRDDATGLSDLLYRLAHMCRWTHAEREGETALAAMTGAPVPPFHMLRIDDDPARQLAYARRWAARTPVSGTVRTFPPRDPLAKIRIGYFSADFHGHATMQLMAGLFEHHDKSQFEIHAFSYGPDDQSGMRTRLIDAVDAFHPVAHISDAAIAELARGQRIDIAVDLKGYTEHGRPGIFAHRAAPHQVAYLGYPGTTGAAFIDYMLADRITIPEADKQHYAEKIVYLPHCYQVNDDKRAIPHAGCRRSDCGLPENAFVFCSFNDNYKISPAEFDIWMRLLGAIEGSVLWLLEGNPWAPMMLRREAAARGIDPERLIFAKKVPVADHLARHRCADLFLDTFLVNAHTTASEALWAGLPIVTMLGRGFASRVAGSLLHAIDLPDLVTHTPQAYEALALSLATDPAKLASVKARLEQNRRSSPLFDTPRFARDIEQAFTQICAGNSAALRLDTPAPLTLGAPGRIRRGLSL